MDTSGVSMKALERAVAVVNRIVLKSSVQPGNSIPNEGKAKVWGRPIDSSHHVGLTSRSETVCERTFESFPTFHLPRRLLIAIVWATSCKALCLIAGEVDKDISQGQRADTCARGQKAREEPCPVLGLACGGVLSSRSQLDHTVNVFQILHHPAYE